MGRLDEIKSKLSSANGESRLYNDDHAIIDAEESEWLVAEVERLRDALQTIEGWTRNPREYQPSYYTIKHVAHNALNGEGDDN